MSRSFSKLNVFASSSPAILLVLAFCFSFSAVKAQVNITLRNPSGMILKPESFLDLDIMNGSTASMNVYVEAELSDLQKPLMKIRSATFTISTGFTSVNSTNVRVASTQYDDEAFREAFIQSGVFPPGSYKYVIRLVEEEVGVLAEISGEEQLSLGPPQLIYPLNASQINTTLPVLTWHGPGMIGLASQPLKYELNLVELLPGQMPLEAINTNPVFFSERNLSMESLPYPASAKALEVGKTYAWQVIAYTGRLIVGKTEVWTFTINQKKTQEELPQGAYIALKDNLDGSVASFTDLLLFKLEGYTATTTPQVKFFSAAHKEITPADLKVIQKYGDNRIAINLRKYNQFKSGEMYFMELLTPEGAVYKLRFNYTNSKKHGILGKNGPFEDF